MFRSKGFCHEIPRGEKELIGTVQRFQARDTVAWFAARGVKLNAECDGRMFPLSNSSQTIIDCLVSAAKAAGVTLRTACRVERVARRAEGGFDLTPTNGETLFCDRLVIGHGRMPDGGRR